MANKKGKFIKGAIIGAVLGVAAGLLLAPKSGKKLRGDIKTIAADFYAQVAPRMKRMANVGAVEFNKFITKAAASYATAKKLSKQETAALVREARSSWRHIRKHF